MTTALAIPPLTMINRGGALIQESALNRENTVIPLSTGRQGCAIIEVLEPSNS